MGAFPNVYKVGSWKKRSLMSIRLLMQVIALFLRSRLKSPPGDSKAQVNGRTGERPEYDYVRVLNRALPDDIRVIGWSPAPIDFHARFVFSRFFL
jgi:tRNA U38,U39,U40 pseudouridine synthase TruA